MNSDDDDEKEMNGGDYRRDFSKFKGTVEIVAHQTLASFFFSLFYFFTIVICHTLFSTPSCCMPVHSVSSFTVWLLFKLSKNI